MSDLLIEWRDEFSVGVSTIDEQHQVLFGLLNQLNEAVANQRGLQETGEILDALTDYTRTHFIVEESLMEVLGYPDRAAHRAEHKALIKKLNALHRRFHAEEPEVADELLHFLKDWLSDHVLGTDQAYVPHFERAAAALREVA
jgi:hemerythrin